MRKILSSRALPRCWAAHSKVVGVQYEADLGLTRSSRLRAKLLIFKNQKSLRSSWSGMLGSDLGPRTLGAVNYLSHERVEFRRGREVSRSFVVDPRYFCVIGLIEGHLSWEIVPHEAVHAACAWLRRAKGLHRDWSHQIERNDEEAIAYPTGRLTDMICEAIARYRGHSKDAA